MFGQGMLSLVKNIPLLRRPLPSQFHSSYSLTLTVHIYHLDKSATEQMLTEIFWYYSYSVTVVCNLRYNFFFFFSVTILEQNKLAITLGQFHHVILAFKSTSPHAILGGYAWKHEFPYRCQGKKCLLPLEFRHWQSGGEKANKNSLN